MKNLQNKELFSSDFTRGKLTALHFTENSIVLEFGSSNYVISGSHDQDCCERVYADFEAIDHYREQLINPWNYYTGLNIIGVPEMGFIIELVGDNVFNKVLIPCYNIQNGYYSSELTLTVSNNGVDLGKIDLMDYQQENID